LAFDYYKRLSPTQQRTYRRSDGVSSIALPQAESLQALTEVLETALASGERRTTEAAAQELLSALVQALKTKPVRVKVLEKRPARNWGELQGLYEPGDPDRITVWMRTARRRQVVAFKTFLRTLLHELCHHLDYEYLGLADTFHTEGFFKRESSLFHQLVRSAAPRRPGT
jgi:hypothetical protein